MRSTRLQRLFLLAFSFLLAVGPVWAADEGDGPEKAIRMKLLILSATGLEPSGQAMTHMLDRLGVPYEHVKLAERPLPPLEERLDGADVGLYQGVILATGNLGVCDPECHSALDKQGWDTLDQYRDKYRVRLVSCYTWPEPRYGLTFAGASYHLGADPAEIRFVPAAAEVFPNLKRVHPVNVQGAYVYRAKPIAGNGETTTPILTFGADVVAAIHTKNNGRRESLALTFDNNWFLFHTRLLHYGLVNWVTKGVFLGERQAYLTAQCDDIFLPNYLFHKDIPACQPVSFAASPTFDPSTYCDTWRMDNTDLDALHDWQDQVRQDPQFENFKVSFAFNGYGTTAEADAPPNDALVSSAIQHKDEFYWINHTFSHVDLDCYDTGVNNDTCRPASYNESEYEILRNTEFGRSLGLPADEQSMITPAVSGLDNPVFLRAAVNYRVRYLVSDLSRPEGRPARPNTGVISPHEPSLLYIPRYPTAIFYNVNTPRENMFGSLTDEYNFLYGPEGYFSLPSGEPFFNQAQTYEQIVERESDAIVGYMLQYEMYPVMFHQSNHHRYLGSRTLFTDVLDSAMLKFSRLTSAPVSSKVQSELGAMLEERAAFLDSGAEALLWPRRREIELTVDAPATVPITGICDEGCFAYGDENHSLVKMEPGVTKFVRAY